MHISKKSQISANMTSLNHTLYNLNTILNEFHYHLMGEHNLMSSLEKPNIHKTIDVPGNFVSTKFSNHWGVLGLYQTSQL